MKMKELCEDERPREKMMSKGAEALSNAELLAILIRTGTKERNALDIARDLMTRCGGRLSEAAALSVDELCATRGIKANKAVGIKAALELGRRFLKEKPEENTCRIMTPHNVNDLMYPSLKGLQHEECWVLFLNRSNKIIAKERISTGGMSSTVLDNRIILRKALEKRATGIILVHNHPSGDPTPRNEDARCTERLKNAAEAFEISLIDHIVISDTKFFSFADERQYSTLK